MQFGSNIIKKVQFGSNVISYGQINNDLVYCDPALSYAIHANMPPSVANINRITKSDFDSFAWDVIRLKYGSNVTLNDVDCMQDHAKLRDDLISLDLGDTQITRFAQSGQSGPINRMYQLTTFILPKNLEVLSYAVGTNLWKLSYVKIPGTVTQFGQYCLGYTHIRREVDMTAFTNPSSLPTIFANSFPDDTGYEGLTYFTVANQTMLNAFKSATNWSSRDIRIKERV